VAAALAAVRERKLTVTMTAIGRHALPQDHGLRDSSPTPVRVFFDCTATWAVGGNTGIQRVVRAVAEHAATVGDGLGCVCQPVVWGVAGWQPIGKLSANPLGVGWLGRTRRLFAELPAARMLSESRARGLFKKTLRAVGASCMMLRRRTVSGGLSFRPGDILFLPDAGWSVPTWPGVHQAKEQGAIVGVMLYDLIPLLLPEVVVAPHVVTFDDWLGRATAHADFFICISQTVAAEAERELGGRYPGFRVRQTPVGAFRLGAELDLVRVPGTIRPALRAIFELPERRVYLMVGTIEPRKNHAYLLDAFDRARARGTAAALCVVGKEGWKCTQVLERIRHHREFGRRLFLFHDLTDRELHYSYEHARALILPSRAEGFGLPVVEALSLGCPVWASDLPVFREVGGEFCRYFDLGSPEALALLLTRDGTGSLAESRGSAAEFRWPNWRASCAELLRTILELGAPCEAALWCPPGRGPHRSWSAGRLSYRSPRTTSLRGAVPVANIFPPADCTGRTPWRSSFGPVRPLGSTLVREISQQTRGPAVPSTNGPMTV